jgi:hypothetical protein
VAPSKLKLNRLFCLEESVWEDELSMTDRTSVQPMLQALRAWGRVERFVHRPVLDVADLEGYLKLRREQADLRAYGLIYLAFHGSPEGLSVGDDAVSLERLAELLGRRCDGARVHLGSCSLLTNDEQAAKAFLKATGASMVSGYRSDIEWLDSAALDLAWLGYLADYERPGDARRYFTKRYASLVDSLGFVAFT